MQRSSEFQNLDGLLQRLETLEQDNRALRAQLSEYTAQVTPQGGPKRATGRPDEVAQAKTRIKELKRTRNYLRSSEEQLRAILESISDAFYALDAEMRVLYVNRRAGEIWGKAPDDIVGRLFTDVFPQVLGTPQWAYHETVRVNRQPVEVEVRSAITGRWLSVHLNPGPDGGVTVYFRDISQRRQSEEQIRFQAHLLDAVEEAVIATDLDGKVLFWNRFAEALYGWPSEEAVGRNVLELTSGSDRTEAEATMAHLREGGRWSGEFTGRRRDGSTFPGQVTDSPVYDPSGQLIGIVGVSYDITQRKRWEEHQRLLLNELNHRVKNTLTTVQAVVVQTLRTACSLEQARHSVEQRLIGLSRAHDVLTREHWEGAQISEVIEQAVAPFLSDGQTRFRCRGPEVRLQPRVALALAMAFQELVTNAVKYGALSNETGAVEVTWLVDHTGTEAHLFLRWEERGGPAVSTPTRRGFGSRLIERSLAADLGSEAKLEFSPEGLVCTVDAPLR